MEIVRPTRQAIRRSFAPGVSLEYVTSPNELEFNAKINFVQVRGEKSSLTFRSFSTTGLCAGLLFLQAL